MFPRGFRYKGAREITQSARFHMFAEGETYTLIINDVYGEDADEYVCRAVNKGGVKSTRAELFIMSKFFSAQFLRSLKSRIFSLDLFFENFSRTETERAAQVQGHGLLRQR